MGKKKGKKKSSSKSKKATNANSNEETTAVMVDVETDTPPSNSTGEELGGSNETIPENSLDTELVKGDLKIPTELGVPLAAETKDGASVGPTPTEVPTREQIISPGDEEYPSHDTSNTEDIDNGPINKTAPPPSESLDEGNAADANVNTDVDYLSNNIESDEVVAEEQPEPNGHVSDGDDAIFLDARSFETEDSKKSIPPVETSGEEGIDKNAERHPELNAEIGGEATNEKDNNNGDTNDDTKQEESDASSKPIVPIETDDQLHMDSQSEQIVETKVEVIKIYDPNPDGEKALHVFDNTYVKNDELERGDSHSNDDTDTTYVDELPLFHYSRIFGAGLPRGIPNNPTGDTNMASVEKHSKCSEFAVVRVNREELVSSTKNITTISPSASDFIDLSRTASANSDTLSTASVSSAAAIRKRQREQTLLLSSDLWFQPHSVLANGYGSGNITLARVIAGQSSGDSDSSPPVVFATPSTEIGGILDTSGHGKSASQKSYTMVLNLQEGGNTASTGSSIVDMSFDASGSVFGAIDGSGHCSIWEFKYTTSLQSTSLLRGDFLSSSDNNAQSDTANRDHFYTPFSTPNPSRPQVSPVATSASNTGMFSNFMSALTGIPPANENFRESNSSHGATNDNVNNSSSSNIATTEDSPSRVIDNNSSHSDRPSQPEALIPALTAEITQQTRSNYPAKWGPPTCLAIDPAYRIKRDKSIIVGFANGQLYLTKKGSFFQRRSDTILYQAGNVGDDSYRGIENVVWRGPLVAFADATGIKLIDSEHLTRIAHINRPAGASISLYPSIRDVSPSLVFETSQHLLVGWGDCLMQICVEEHEEDASSSTPSLAQSGGSSEAGSRDIKIRRTATCTMAWELDCVACDIVPLDSNHIAVLGLVSLTEDGEEGNQMRGPSHDLEMQILSREDGTISYSDSLPLIEEKRGSIESLLSARDFRLLSSFALPRMGNKDETKALRALKGANDMGFVGIDVGFDINQPLFAGTDSYAKKGIEFRDPHLEWNIKAIMYDEDADEETHMLGLSNKDDSSVDSDDYECILRPIETIQPLPSQSSDATDQSALPPNMLVCTHSEAILSLTSTVDDAIEYSLHNHKCARALSRGLRHKRQLRRYNLDDLISFYLEAVLRIPRFIKEQEDSSTSAQPNTSPSLSLRRMQLAIKAMPVLLGDRIELWERWTKELENIPGSLLLLRKYLPVRGTSQISIISCLSQDNWFDIFFVWRNSNPNFFLFFHIQQIQFFLHQYTFVFSKKCLAKWNS